MNSSHCVGVNCAICVDGGKEPDSITNRFLRVPGEGFLRKISPYENLNRGLWHSEKKHMKSVVRDQIAIAVSPPQKQSRVRRRWDYQ